MIRIRPGQPGQDPEGNSPPLRPNVSSRGRTTSEIMMSSPDGDLEGPHHPGPRLLDDVLPQSVLPVTGAKRPRPDTSSCGSSLAQALDLDPGANYFENFWQTNQERHLAHSPDGRFDPAAVSSSVITAASPPSRPPRRSGVPRPAFRQQPSRLVKKPRNK